MLTVCFLVLFLLQWHDFLKITNFSTIEKPASYLMFSVINFLKDFLLCSSCCIGLQWKDFWENQDMINFWRDLHCFSSLEVIIVLISSHSQLETLKTYWIYIYRFRHFSFLPFSIIPFNTHGLLFKHITK